MDLHDARTITMGILLLTALAAPVSATPVFDDGPLADDDAGSGKDAPELAAVALPISAGTHGGGFLAPHDRWDWYRVDAPARFVHVVLDEPSACLQLEQEGRLLAVGCPMEGRGVSLWTFVTTGLPLQVGVERVTAGQYHLSVGIDDYATGARTAAGDDDVGGRDVPDIPVSLSVLHEDARAQGTVGTVQGDVADWYLVSAPPGVELTVTVDHVGLGCIRLVSGDEATAGPVCMVDPMQGRTVLQQHAGDAPVFLGLGGWALVYSVTVTWGG